MSDRNDFLGDNYSRPTSNSMIVSKIEQGNTKIRILTRPVYGYVAYKPQGEDKKPIPVRIKLDEQFDFKPDPAKPAKYFWAFLAWNFNTNRIELWELTKKTIISKIETLIDMEEFGNPLNYNISISRKGDGMDTEYEAVGLPKSELSPEIKKALEETKLDPSSIFTKKQVIGGTDGSDMDEGEVNIEDVPF